MATMIRSNAVTSGANYAWLQDLVVNSASDPDFIQTIAELWRLTAEEAEVVAASMDRYVSRYLHIIDAAESPIERIFGIHLLGWADHVLSLAHITTVIVPQYELIVEGERFRVDFFVRAWSRKKEVTLAVECDGYDFHDRTPEKATRDKWRDRLLAIAGHHVLRFTGSEISRNPNACARDVVKFILGHLSERNG